MADDKKWHAEVLAAPTEAVLRDLSQTPLLEDFYLAGGTGLALHFGHRRSEDLDFFSRKLFDEESLLQRLQTRAGFALTARAPHSLHARMGEAKVTFLGYDYPILFVPARYLSVAVADPQDIACMKIAAVASRGTKRDFVDLHACAARLGLAYLLELFERKYSPAHYNLLHVLKSLTYFEDAEKDPMPHLLVSRSWDEVKQFFLREVPRLSK